MAYGYGRMSSLVPELVKKRCKSINAETSVSVNVLKNAFTPVRNAHLAVMGAFAPASSFAAACA